ncbi:hypothetical protein [Sphingomonas humi]|uniref:Uncharacterized protein n=1 Tax=Sphingomonas humi TaxID=335630 RepID=A0ABP7RHR3_9SPHN
MRLLAAFALLATAVPVAAQSRQQATFTCVADASGAGLTAQTRRLLDGRGDLRQGSLTTITLPLTGAGGSLEASWEVRFGLPKVERGTYLFRLPPPLLATWQLAGAPKPVRAKDGVLTLSGKQFSAMLAGGAPIALVLVGRNGQERARATLDRQAFDVALDLVRQADARALAKASSYRSTCPRS